MKKVIVNSENLKAAFNKLGLAMIPNPVLQVIKNVYIRVFPHNLELITTNMDITIQYRIECESNDSFEFLMPYEFLTKIVGLNQACPLSFEVTDNQVVIIGPNDRYQITPGETVSDFPKIPKVPSKNSCEIKLEHLQSMQMAVATCAKPDVTPKFSNVLLELSEGKICIASTDGSYVVYSKEFEHEQKDSQELLIRQNVIKALSGTDKCTLLYHAKSIAFECKHMTVISTRSEEKFANFRAVFPADWPANLMIQRSDLIHSLSKCSLSNDPLKTTHINLSDSDESIQLRAEDSIINIKVDVPGRYAGEVSNVAVNSDKLQKMLMQINCSEIGLAIHDSARAIILTADDEPGYKGMIMPISAPHS